MIKLTAIINPWTLVVVLQPTLDRARTMVFHNIQLLGCDPANCRYNIETAAPDYTLSPYDCQHKEYTTDELSLLTSSVPTILHAFHPAVCTCPSCDPSQK